MKRLRRIAWNGLVAISALLCIVVFVPVNVTVMRWGDTARLRWWQSGGGTYLFYDNLRLPPDFLHGWNNLKSHPVEFHYLMVEIIRVADVPETPVARVIITIPWWFSLPTFALLPTLWLLRKVPRRRMASAVALHAATISEQRRRFALNAVQASHQAEAGYERTAGPNKSATSAA